MQDKSDALLLREYALRGSEPAFREIVIRHTDLAYSTALRCVSSSDLASDIAQSVFTDLARKARPLADKLAENASLAGWLYRSTRYTALNQARTERRRLAHERQAMEQFLSHPENPSDWDRIRPVLDEAMDNLADEDRDAVLLRYFKNHDFRAVGFALGVSDDAAQKRVSRAVERLRAFFAERGITVGASGLAIVISTNAVQAAPVGLAVSISTVATLAGTTMATTAIATATNAILMTTLQKTLVTVVITAAVGTGIYQARQASHLRQEVQTLHQQQTALSEQNEQLSRERDEAVQQLETASTKPVPRLPAPQMENAAAPAQPPAGDLQSSNLMVRLLNGETPKLTAEQIEDYLRENRRNAASLLAVFRATGDKSFLNEAMEKFPDDPRVAFDSVFKGDSPEERRQRLENFKRAAPDNAMASYLSALDHFRSGQTDQAVKDLIAAAGKPQFQDYSWDFVQNAEEAWRTAGYSEAETRMVATWQLLLPHASELNQLHKSIMDLASAYQQAGDPASAQAALLFNLQLGQQLNGSPNDPLINQLIGLAIQRDALGAMDPTTAYGTTGLTVADRIEQLKQQSATIKNLVAQMEPLQQAMSPQDWITYNDRTRAFGEVNALQWLAEKYRQK